MHPPPLLTVLGGVALLVFGVRYLRKGLDRLFGRRLIAWMQRLAARPGWSFLAGLGVSVLAPSSTTMSLLAVQSMQTGHLTARQMLAIVLGANVGLTVMVALIALRLEQFAPALILIGVALFQFTRGNRSRGAGQVVLALGFILLAIDLMRRAAAAAQQAAAAGPPGAWGVINFENLQQHPLLLAIFAAAAAMALQSSTATIGLLIGLGAADAVSFKLAVPVVLGANVGLAFTTLVVAWRQLEPRRLAIANLLLKVAVAAVGLLAVRLLGDALPAPAGGRLGLAIAAVHTGYNVIVAGVGLPLLGPVTILTTRLVPPPTRRRRAFGPKYIAGGPVAGAALAMGQSLREVIHISEIARGMLRDVWTALWEKDEKLAREVAERDDQIDLLDAEVKRFLTRLVKEELGDFDADEQMRQLRYLAELETIGDIVDKNLTELALKRIRLGAEFSDEGARDLREFYDKVHENMVIAETAFATRDTALARQLLRHKERVDQHERELRDRHFARLNAGLVEAHETSAIHLDLLTHLKRINSCVSHVAYAILQPTETAATQPEVE